MRRAKPFKIERRPLASLRGGKVEAESYTDMVGPEIAVSELPTRYLSHVADDVARLLAGKTSFPRVLWGGAR